MGEAGEDKIVDNKAKMRHQHINLTADKGANAARVDHGHVQSFCKPAYDRHPVCNEEFKPNLAKLIHKADVVLV